MMDADTDKLKADKNIYETSGSRARAPGTEGIWTFVFIDMLVFLLIFFVFMAERHDHFELYKTSQLSLDAIFGFANTLILLTSSWLVVEAIESAKARSPSRVSKQLNLALLLGAVFLVNKVIEYHLKIEAGIGPTKNPFFTFYYFITFCHFLHVIAGMLYLSAFARGSTRCRDSEKYVTGLENVGLFWHYVDVLWIFIFPLLYLV